MTSVCIEGHRLPDTFASPCFRCGAISRVSLSFLIEKFVSPLWEFSSYRKIRIFIENVRVSMSNDTKKI